MGATRVLVRLRIEPAVLGSALQQVLARNPALDVEFCPPDTGTGNGVDMTRRQGVGRVVEITLIEDPFRFLLETDGHVWVVNYQGLDDLGHRLTDLADWRVVFG